MDADFARAASTNGLSAGSSRNRATSATALSNNVNCAEHVTEQARYAERDVDARTAKLGQRFALDPRHAIGSLVPDRPTPSNARAVASSSPPVRSVALPQRSSTMARGHWPWSRDVPLENGFRGALAVGPRGGRRNRARIDAEKIAPRRQHIGSAAARGTGRPWLDEAPVKGADERVKFGVVKDMQAVADAQLFDVAEEGIDAGQRVGRRHAAFKAASLRNPRTHRGIDDLGGERLAPARVEAVGRREFVDQFFDFAQWASEARVGHRRRPMAERHGRDAALRLRGFARIVDDERIDERQAPSRAPGAQASLPATALPGSHSSVPCAPRWISASIFATWRSQR